jgi:hypothetical protein
MTNSGEEITTNNSEDDTQTSEVSEHGLYDKLGGILKLLCRPNDRPRLPKS